MVSRRSKLRATRIPFTENVINEYEDNPYEEVDSDPDAYLLDGDEGLADEDVIEDEAPEVYVAERIVNKRITGQKRTVQYLIKWQGLGDEYNTWESLKNLVGFERMIDDFERSVEQKPTSGQSAPMKPPKVLKNNLLLVILDTILVIAILMLATLTIYLFTAIIEFPDNQLNPTIIPGVAPKRA